MTKKQLLGALLIVLLLAGGLRFWGINHSINTDENKLVVPSVKLARGEQEPRLYPKGSYYPHLYHYVLGAVFWPVAQLYPNKTFDNFYNNTYLLIARVMSALVSTVVCLVVFSLGRRLHGPTVGLLAALIMAVMPLHAKYAHYAHVDIPLVLFFCLTLYAAIRLWQTPTPRWYLLTGLLIGFSGAVLYTGFIFGIVLLLAHAAYVVRTKINLRTIFRPAFIGALLVIPIAFVAVSPYSILRRAEILQGYERLAARAAAGDLGYTRPDLWWPLYTDSLDWGLTFTSGGFIWEIGLLTMALAAVGLCVAYYKKSWPMFWLVGGTFLVFYLVTAGYVRMSAIKRFLPLVPLVALAAAYGIYNLPLFLRSFSPQVVRVFQGILVALIVIPNSWAIAGFNVAYSHGSTHLEAVAWFREHIPKGTTLLQHGPLILLSPDDPDYRVVRLNEVYASLNAADPEVAHDRAKPLEEWIAKEHVQVVYLDARMVDRYYDTTSMRLFPETTASYRAFYDSIRREGKLLYRAEPKLWEIAGPGIELYEVSPLMPTP